MLDSTIGCELTWTGY